MKKRISILILALLCIFCNPVSSEEYANMIGEITTTTGTGTIALGGARSGYQAFASELTSGDEVKYKIYEIIDLDSNGEKDWEIGTGTYTTGYLSRDTIEDSSNADSAVDWGAGTKYVHVILSAEQIASFGAGSGAVDSVNGETGVVVINPDDLDDSATTNKFVTAAQEAQIAANVLKDTYPSADSTKVGQLTVTQDVNLDTIESDTATNNAKPTISSGSGAPSSTPTKVGDTYIDTTGDASYTAVGTASSADWQKDNDGTPEGTAVLSTGEAGGTKVLTENGSGGATWEEPAMGSESDPTVDTSAKIQNILGEATSLDNGYMPAEKIQEIEINTSVRHAELSLGTANGLSLSTQALSLAAATNSTPGAATAAQVTEQERVTALLLANKIILGDDADTDEGLMGWDATLDQLEIGYGAGIKVFQPEGEDTNYQDADSDLDTVATNGVGTGANQIVQLNGSAELPAVSGANLTNLSAAGDSWTWETVTESTNIADHYVYFVDIGSGTIVFTDTITAPAMGDTFKIVRPYNGVTMSADPDDLNMHQVNETLTALGTGTYEFAYTNADVGWYLLDYESRVALTYPSPADYTDCSEQGDFELYWNADHASSNVTFCTASSTDTGTLTGTTIVDSASDPGTEGSLSGGNVLKHDGSWTRIDIPITATEFDSGEGHIKADFYFVVLPTAAITILVVVNGSDSFTVTVQTDGTVRFTAISKGVSTFVNSSDIITAEQWDTIEIKWDATLGAGNSELFVKVNNGSWLGDTDAGDYTGFTSEPTNIVMPYSATTDAVYIDDVYCDLTSP